jgi:mRNA-degrading endonuclease RelE of RelBE toxin-antitoxin system
MVLKVLSTPSFDRVVKKMHARDKKVVDQAVMAIAADPAIGEEKKGDLAEVFVYKYKVNKQEILLAYRLQPNKKKPQEVVLLNIGSHENFYATMKR